MKRETVATHFFSKRRATFLVWAMVLLAAGAAIFWGGDWRLLATQYRLWRLDGAEDEQAATNWLDELYRDAVRPEAAVVIVTKLGLKYPRFTFWMFHSLAEELVPQGETRRSGSAGAQRLYYALLKRLKQDEALLRSWTHFLRWRGLVNHQIWTGEIAGSPAEMEGRLLLSQMQLLAAIWFLNLDPKPAIPEIPPIYRPQDWERLVKKGGPLEDLQAVINRWILDHQHRLRYDSRLGRYMPIAESQLSEVNPVNTPALLAPDTPLPGWQGPVLTVDGGINAFWWPPGGPGR